MSIRLAIWFLQVTIGCYLLVSPGSSAFAQTQFAGTTMGPIEYRVVIHDEVQELEVLETGIQARLDEVNQLMSTYIDSSDVTRVNNSVADRWVAVDLLTLTVIKKSLEFSERTAGAFDITVGPAVDLWKFGPDKNLREIPSDELVATVRKYVGFQNIEFRTDPPAVKKRHDKTKIDLSAIAKGFAVDRVAEFLVDKSFKNFMVEVGGEVVVRGSSDAGKWRIGIEKPTESERTVSAVVNLDNKALATSGDYRNFRLIDGKRYSHTIDPKTCRPVENNVASCSVIADDCLTADAIATAVMVMGSPKGLEFCRTNNLAVSITSRNPTVDARFSTVSTDAFPIDTRIMVKPITNQSRSIWPAFIGALIVFSLAIAGMAVGAIFNNRPITGSCGGIASTPNEDGSSACSLCEKPVTDCPENQAG